MKCTALKQMEEHILLVCESPLPMVPFEEKQVVLVLQYVAEFIVDAHTVLGVPIGVYLGHRAIH